MILGKRSGPNPHLKKTFAAMKDSVIEDLVYSLSHVMRKPVCGFRPGQTSVVLHYNRDQMSRVIKQCFAYAKTKTQRLCFRYIDCTIPLLSKSEILSLLPSSVAVQPG